MLQYNVTQKNGIWLGIQEKEYKNAWYSRKWLNWLLGRAEIQQTSREDSALQVKVTATANVRGKDTDSSIN